MIVTMDLHEVDAAKNILKTDVENHKSLTIMTQKTIESSTPLI